MGGGGGGGGVEQEDIKTAGAESGSVMAQWNVNTEG